MSENYVHIAFVRFEVDIEQIAEDRYGSAERVDPDVEQHLNELLVRNTHSSGFIDDDQADCSPCGVPQTGGQPQYESAPNLIPVNGIATAVSISLAMADIRRKRRLRSAAPKCEKSAEAAAMLSFTGRNRLRSDNSSNPWAFRSGLEAY